MWDELHDPYSPAARCRSKLRFWVSLKVAYVFICEECRGIVNLQRKFVARRADDHLGGGTAGPLPPCSEGHYPGAVSGPLAAPDGTSYPR